MAMTIRNLPAVTNLLARSGQGSQVFSRATARKAMTNQGKSAPGYSRRFRGIFLRRASRAVRTARVKVIGTIISVRVSLTIVA
jgi:hypothetical protein